jgi:hypothetical protein
MSASTIVIYSGHICITWVMWLQWDTISIALSIVLGLLSIAVAIYFGTRDLRGMLREKIDRLIATVDALSGKVDDIRVKATFIEELLKHISSMKGMRTVERIFKNLGRVKITADPYRNETVYYLEFERDIILKPGLISKLAKETGLADEGIKLFGQEPTYFVFSPSRMMVTIPSSDAKACVNYISKYLRWLDEVYYVKTEEETKKFEELE